MESLQLQVLIRTFSTTCAELSEGFQGEEMWSEWSCGFCGPQGTPPGALAWLIELAHFAQAALAALAIK